MYLHPAEDLADNISSFIFFIASKGFTKTARFFLSDQDCPKTNLKICRLEAPLHIVETKMKFPFYCLLRQNHNRTL